MREGSGRGLVVGPLFPDQWLCPRLPWLLLPLPCPPFPGHIRPDNRSGHCYSARNTSIAGVTSMEGLPPQRFEHFTSVSFITPGGQGHRRGHGGWVDLSVHARTRAALKFRGKRQSSAAPVKDLQRNTTVVGWDIVCWRTNPYRVVKKPYVHATRQPNTWLHSDCRLQLEPFFAPPLN